MIPTPHLKSILNSLGAEGWELVAASPLTGYQYTPAEVNKLYGKHPNDFEGDYRHIADELHRTPEPRFFHVVLKKVGAA